MVIIVVVGVLASMVFYTLVLAAVDAIVGRLFLSRTKRIWDGIDAVQRSDTRHEHVTGVGTIQGLVGKGYCPICGEFVDNERAA